MKKKATARPAKATSRQPTLNFPTSSEADLVAESTAAETATKSGTKNRRKTTADFVDDADKHNETNGDSSVPVSSAPTERNKIAQGKKRSAAALGQHPSTTESPEGAIEPSSSTKNRGKRTADFADDADNLNKAQCDSSAQSAVKPSRELLDLSTLPPLPMGWTWVVPSDVCQTVASGSTPKPTEMFSGNGEIPFLKVYNLTHTGHLDFTIKPTFISRATHEGMLGRSRTSPGDVLMNIVGPPLGKVSIVPDHVPEANINQAIVVFRVGPRLLPKYLAFALLTDSVLRRLTSKAKATAGQSNIGVGMCRSLLPIPIAPLPEQHRIVAEIEKQFTRLDAGVAALKRVQANLKRYRAAALKAACEGKLVPTEAELARHEGRTYETGEQLLQRILTERRESWQGRGNYNEPIPPETAGLPPLPDGWCYTSAEQVCSTVASGSTPLAPKMFSDSGEVPFLKVYNLTHNGALNFAVKPTYIERQTHEGQLARSRVSPRDVLMNIVGPPLGKVSFVPDNFPECNINQAIVVFRPTSAILNRLLTYWLLSDHVLGRLAITAKATAGQFNLQVTACRKLALPLPPMAEQIRIVAEVERRLSVVEELEAVVATNLQRTVRLRQSILKRAFAGTLI